MFKCMGRTVQGLNIHMHGANCPQANRPGDESSGGEMSRRRNVQAGDETCWRRNDEGLKPPVNGRSIYEEAHLVIPNHGPPRFKYIDSLVH